MLAGAVGFDTAWDSAKILVVNFRKRLELLDYVHFVCVSEQTVALQAAGVWRDHFREVKPSDHFENLLRRVLRSRAIAVPDDFVHEQAAISRKQGAIVRAARGEGRIGGGGRVNDIEAEEAKVTRQFSEMAVRDESRNAPFLQSLARLCGRIDHAMDIDDCTRDQAMLKAHGLAIAAYQ